MRKTTIIHLILIMMLSPYLSASDLNMQQSWWQRKKAKTPPEIINTWQDAEGHELEIEFTKGKRHNHPLMAFWIEDSDGNYVQSLYVAQSIAKGYFRHGDPSSGRWEPGPLRRPAALPYWGHKRGVQAPDGYYTPSQDTPMPDAVTGATPKNNFKIHTKTESKNLKVFYIYMEINQSWDWNRHWHNNLYPDDPYYKTSSQPALVYRAKVDLNNPQEEYELEIIGHSHYAGANGEINEDISTITTAADITEKVVVRIR